jgi:hypothetical protein
MTAKRTIRCAHCRAPVTRTESWYAAQGDKPVYCSGRCKVRARAEAREGDMMAARAGLLLRVAGEDES